MATELKLCTYNILAPCWAKLSSYPELSWPYIDKELRRTRIIATLTDLAETHDIIALQETQEDELPYIYNALENLGFNGFHVHHDDTYWEQYITEDPPFASNGVALFWKTATVTMTEIAGHPFSESGNHGIIGIFVKDGKTFRVACAHLDSDHGGWRAKESKAMVALLEPMQNVVDIIIGDLNFNTAHGPYNNIFKANNFTNLLKVLGTEELTHCYNSSYGGNDNWGIIDQILYRGADVLPVAGQVLNFNVWNDGQNEAERSALLFQRNGSDHFVVTGTISMQ